MSFPTRRTRSSFQSLVSTDDDISNPISEERFLIAIVLLFRYHFFHRMLTCYETIFCQKGFVCFVRICNYYSIADKHNMINALPEKPKYPTIDIKYIADNILLFQKDNGGWPKNHDMFAIPNPEQKESVLADVYNVTGEEMYRDTAQKGLGFNSIKTVCGRNTILLRKIITVATSLSTMVLLRAS